MESALGDLTNRKVCSDRGINQVLSELSSDLRHHVVSILAIFGRNAHQYKAGFDSATPQAETDDR
jgi:hypothetical protein